MNQNLFQTPRPYTDSPLVTFPDVSSANVLNVLSSLPNKSSPCDILPTSLLKSCANVFAPLITHLTNCSLSENTFPTLFKTAQVLPPLKKPGLDRANQGNYRPISNLNTISKVGKIGHFSPLAAPAIIMQFQHSSISLPHRTLDRKCCVEDARQFLFHRR